jgi:endoglucanase
MNGAAALACAALLAVPGAAQACDGNLVHNGHFNHGTEYWEWTANAPSSVVDGALCADVEDGVVNFYDADVGQEKIPLTQGRSYVLSFRASASRALTIVTKVQLVTAAPPYPNELVQATALTPSWQRFSYPFTADTSSTAGDVAFQLGGHGPALRFCVDDVSLVAS